MLLIHLPASWKGFCIHQSIQVMSVSPWVVLQVDLSNNTRSFSNLERVFHWVLEHSKCYRFLLQHQQTNPPAGFVSASTRTRGKHNSLLTVNRLDFLFLLLVGRPKKLGRRWSLTWSLCWGCGRLTWGRLLAVWLEWVWGKYWRHRWKPSCRTSLLGLLVGSFVGAPVPQNASHLLLEVSPKRTFIKGQHNLLSLTRPSYGAVPFQSQELMRNCIRILLQLYLL
mmetsp:Transcript_22109/g.48123  ORF Transcript_22109/g.48123 Transcript_22109/m.48123 type:complete len:224 (-) Transcript_22109:49-720(-)